MTYCVLVASGYLAMNALRTSLGPDASELNGAIDVTTNSRLASAALAGPASSAGLNDGFEARNVASYPEASATPTAEAVCAGVLVSRTNFTPALRSAVISGVRSVSVGLIFCSTSVRPYSLAAARLPA